ncbi:MAG: ATP-dependent DNA helicase [Wenzhouxiangellaceae bacterium]
MARTGVRRMTINDTLGATGPFASQLPGFRPRPGQQQLAAAVDQCLHHSGILVAEAATGTGKTLAYLAPALQSRLKVLISTGTKTLQDQLFQRDLPMARSALQVQPRCALLKGRSNYLCLFRLELARADGRLRNRELVSQLHEVHAWSTSTRSGEISELVSLPENAAVLPLVTSTVDNCLGSECPRYGDCYLIKARRRALEADVVVVNHHLLFADMALKDEGYGEVLPTTEAFIIDEAHQVPDTATRFFSRSLSSRQLRDLGRDIERAAGQVSGAFGTVQEPLAQIEQSSRQLALLFAALNERGPATELLRSRGLLEQLAELEQQLDELQLALQPLAEAERGLANAAERCQRLRAVLREYQAEESEAVRWYERRRQGFAINLTPLDVASPLARFRAARPAAWVFTSATLAVGNNFQHFLQRLGLEDAETLQVDSPFDHRHNALCWLPPDLPPPGDRQHTASLLRAVWPLIEVSGGRAFLLFTTHRALQQAAEWLRLHSSYPLFIQGEAPRSQLVSDFRAAGNGILLGAASFWEGVDVPGPALSLVVIDKLPFAAPDDPVLQARLEEIKQQGGNPFTEVQLPEAVLALKQGAGRLIRDHSDRGVVVLGDPRLTGKGYGRLFLNSLPPWPRTRELQDAIAFMATTLAPDLPATTADNPTVTGE